MTDPAEMVAHVLRTLRRRDAFSGTGLKLPTEPDAAAVLAVVRQWHRGLERRPTLVRAAEELLEAMAALDAVGGDQRQQAITLGSRWAGFELAASGIPGQLAAERFRKQKAGAGKRKAEKEASQRAYADAPALIREIVAGGKHKSVTAVLGEFRDRWSTSLPDGDRALKVQIGKMIRQELDLEFAPRVVGRRRLLPSGKRDGS